MDNTWLFTDLPTPAPVQEQSKSPLKTCISVSGVRPFLCSHIYTHLATWENKGQWYQKVQTKTAIWVLTRLTLGLKKDTLGQHKSGPNSGE